MYYSDDLVTAFTPGRLLFNLSCTSNIRNNCCYIMYNMVSRSGLCNVAVKGATEFKIITTVKGPHCKRLLLTVFCTA